MERWGGWVMDIGEGMCDGKCCELCKTDESQTCTSETNNAVYVNFKKMYCKYKGSENPKMFDNWEVKISISRCYVYYIFNPK